MSGQHARLAPSASHRWLFCTPSAEAEAQAVAEEPSLNESGAAAQKGTIIHAMAEHWTERPALPDTSGTDNVWAEVVEEFGSKYDLNVFARHERSWAIRTALDFRAECLSHVSLSGDTKHWLELRVRPTSIHESIFGSADFACMNFTTGVATLRDLKTGRHIVKAEGNTQLLVYADGLRNHIESTTGISPTHYDLGIYQPERGEDDELDTVLVSAAQLAAFTKMAAVRANDAFVGAGEFRPDDSVCRWCKARFDCKALANIRAAEIGKLFEEEPEPAVFEKVDDHLLGELIAKAKTINDYIDGLKIEAAKRMVMGYPIPGMKLVKKSNRSTVDVAKLQQVFGDDAFKLVPRSKADLRDSGFDLDDLDLCYAPPTSFELVAAPSSDRRRNQSPA